MPTENEQAKRDREGSDACAQAMRDNRDDARSQAKRDRRDDARAQAKRDREKKTVTKMIEVYCCGNHKEVRERERAEGGLTYLPDAKRGLCSECAKLAEYTQKRTQNCPRIMTKTFCSSCDIHCYTDAQRQRIREVMRYAGPRMMYHDPIGAIRHGIDTARAARAEKKRSQG